MDQWVHQVLIITYVAMYCNLTPGKDQNLIFVIGNICIELMRVSTMYTTVYGNIVIDSWLLYNKNNGRNFKIHLVQNLAICQCHTTTTLVHGVESLLILYAWNSSANRMKVKIYICEIVCLWYVQCVSEKVFCCRQPLAMGLCVCVQCVSEKVFCCRQPLAMGLCF